MARGVGETSGGVPGGPGRLVERTDVGEGPAARRPRFAALDGFGVSELTFLAEGEEPQCPLWGFDFR